MLNYSQECLTNYLVTLYPSMRIFWISTATTASLFVVTLTATPTQAAASQTVDRSVSSSTSSRTTTSTKAKPADSKPSSTKPVSTTGVTATTTTAKKDRPGKRFWGRIMDHFRDIHSAEKKPK
ncbi:hypothetical protein FAES_2489 [Fibrella aestuarina BUZ 2]|uniref:Uncharacterized protein n=2 Tax=Fibrella TaxID=861914 RepID=I0K8P5_9BACT|nr:hypothetical protein FAES_2489 [Fibrella aestuarina BUZ 2]